MALAHSKLKGKGYVQQKQMDNLKFAHHHFSKPDLSQVTNTYVSKLYSVSFVLTYPKCKKCDCRTCGSEDYICTLP